ncbi:hypothetical protein M885DRAFT_141536 [Pelagophyceae sp. CCMP2097]|nr:hypothetical protein M885DRAFT_141536 [Pelagophyceae sp. CCMP2097]
MVMDRFEGRLEGSFQGAVETGPYRGTIKRDVRTEGPKKPRKGSVSRTSRKGSCTGPASRDRRVKGRAMVRIPHWQKRTERGQRAGELDAVKRVLLPRERCQSRILYSYTVQYKSRQTSDVRYKAVIFQIDCVCVVAVVLEELVAGGAGAVRKPAETVERGGGA